MPHDVDRGVHRELERHRPNLPRRRRGLHPGCDATLAAQDHRPARPRIRLSVERAGRAKPPGRHPGRGPRHAGGDRGRHRLPRAPDADRRRGLRVRLDAAGDHRIALAAAVAGLAVDGRSVVTGWDAHRVSYPGFTDALDALRGGS
ncbi:MAG: hypothetical protein K6U88_15835 [Dehalococcoidia bacterium]|nr:hypothetical protein [Dehalococcoidia bacterium]